MSRKTPPIQPASGWRVETHITPGRKTRFRATDDAKKIGPLRKSENSAAADSWVLSGRPRP